MAGARTPSVLPMRHRRDKRTTGAALRYAVRFNPKLAALVACSIVIWAVRAMYNTWSSSDLEPLPEPIFVVAGGAPRTGSTFMFNILRVLMRQRDPNTVASSNWMLAKLVPENSTITEYDRVALLKTLGTSILVKLHTAHQYYEFIGPNRTQRFADDVDLLVTSYRDLRDEAVSAFKMFAANRSAFDVPEKWGNLCRSLIRKRDSLINEAGSKVPVVDVRYEDWKHGGQRELEQLVHRMAQALPWKYTRAEERAALNEVRRLQVPRGGEPEARINWHVANLMSPKHISHEVLDESFIRMGVRAVEEEPVCADWLKTKQYMSDVPV